jgi:hypothetical protein
VDGWKAFPEDLGNKKPPIGELVLVNQIIEIFLGNEGKLTVFLTVFIKNRIGIQLIL